MNKILLVIAFVFLSFILWVIYQANTGQSTIFFDIVARIPNGDKLGHFFLFGILTVLLNLALKLKGIRIGKLKLPIGSILVLVFVTLEELSQAYIPNRTLDVQDFLADCFGILFFTVIGHTFFKNKSLEIDELG